MILVWKMGNLSFSYNWIQGLDDVMESWSLSITLFCSSLSWHWVQVTSSSHKAASTSSLQPPLKFLVFMIGVAVTSCEYQGLQSLTEAPATYLSPLHRVSHLGWKSASRECCFPRRKWGLCLQADWICSCKTWRCCLLPSSFFKKSEFSGIDWMK